MAGNYKYFIYSHLFVTESLPDINKYIVCIEINKYRVATKRMRIRMNYILTHVHRHAPELTASSILQNEHYRKAWLKSVLEQKRLVFTIKF